MKKTFLATLIITLLCTTLSFAQPSENILSAVKDLGRVENDLGIIIDSIISCKYDEESIRKTLDFDIGIINNIYSKCYVDYNIQDSTLVKRENGTVLYISSVYGLAINGILLYLEDKNNYKTYFLDSISQYRIGKITLDEFKVFLAKKYKLNIS